jgi:YggT family protein
VLAQAAAFVLDALASLFILAALVRFWMQAFRAPSRNPIAQFTMALTDWAVKPLRRVIPGFARLDWSSLVVAFAFEFLLQVLLFVLLRGGLPDNPTVLSVLLFMAFVKLIRLRSTCSWARSSSASRSRG